MTQYTIPRRRLSTAEPGADCTDDRAGRGGGRSEHRPQAEHATDDAAAVGLSYGAYLHAGTAEDWGIEVHVGGALVQARRWNTEQRAAPGVKRGGLRGCIRGFSKSSRRRMFKRMAMFTDEALSKSLFVTLTYPEAYPDAEQAKEQLRALEARIQRKYGRECVGYDEFKDAAGRTRRRKQWKPISVGIIWRLEFQERGAPHFHLLVLGVSYMEHKWLSQAWYEVVGSGDPRHLEAGTEVRRVRNAMHARRYLDKYLAKTDQAGGGQDVIGRCWGMVGAWKEFLAPVMLLRFSPSQAAQMVRWIERHQRAQARGRRRAYRRKRRRRWSMTRARRHYGPKPERTKRRGKWVKVRVQLPDGAAEAVQGMAFEQIEREPVESGYWYTNTSLLALNWQQIVGPGERMQNYSRSQLLSL